MKHLAAYLLANLSGNTPTNENIKDILSSVGIEADEARLSLLFSSLGGKDLNALIAEGSSKLASMPSVSVGGDAASSGGAAASSGAAAAAVEEKKEEAVKEDEESDDDMGFGLFD